MTDTPTPPAGPGEVIHLAGADVQIGPHVRQRCSWCGAVLIDQDLRLVAVPVTEGQEPRPYPTWPIGSLIAHDGAAWWVVEDTPHPDGEDIYAIPPASCMALDPALTGGRT